MFYHREHLIERQVLANKRLATSRLVTPDDLKQLYSRAYEELRLSKINNCELDFNNIGLFLLLSTPREQNDFFLMLRQAIAQILADDRKRRIFEDKWSAVLRSNCMKLFYKMGQEMLDGVPADWKREMLKLYVQVAEKVLRDERIWRIQEKFLEGFVTESLVNPSEGRRILGDYRESLYQLGRKFSQSPASTEIPKSLSNVHYLQFGLLRLLEIAIPNQQYLQNQFLHAPNPKFLLPLSTRKTFTPLTNEMLLKLNKVDMVALKFWHMYEYEPSDLYEKIRKARGWEPKVEVLLLGIKSKLQEGLFRYINLINDLVLRHTHKECSDEANNQLLSYVEIALEICRKHSEPQAEQTALEKIDIGLAFQLFNTQTRSGRQKEFLMRLVELYLILMLACRKQKIKLRSIKDISTNIYKLIKFNRDDKLTREVCAIVDRHFPAFSVDEKEEFFMEIVREVNSEWTAEQKNSAEVVRVESNVLTLMAHTVMRHEISFLNKNKLSVLEFLLILSFNEHEKSYNEVKKALCYLNLELGYSLAGSVVFGFLQNRQSPTFASFRQKLMLKYGTYNFERQLGKYEFEGLLAIIDEIVVFRITGLRERIVQGLPLTTSYFSVLVQFLDECQKLSLEMYRMVERYFETCVRTYMIEYRRAKVKDSYKEQVRELTKLDIGFLIQSSASANPTIAQFSLKCLQGFIEEVPEMAFFTRMLMVFIEVLSFLYEKVSQEYDSKSEAMRGRYLHESVLIPTDIKEISQRLISIMTSLYQVILRGHCIHDTYLKMRVGYLVREENTRTTKLNFGCKFLKYLINNFKEDRDFIDREVLIGNSCLWWINEEEFSKRIRMLKGESVLLDKSLLPLHRNCCSLKDLQNIFTSVRPQIETEFLTVLQEASYDRIDELVGQVDLQASNIHRLEMQQSSAEDIENAHNRLFEMVGQVKTIQLSQTKRIHLLSQLLDVCKHWFNRGLLKYILFKIVPFLYCSGSYNSGVIALIAEMLHYLTVEINKAGLFNPTLHVSDQDIFNLKLDFLAGVENYESKELDQGYIKAHEALRRARKLPTGRQPSSQCVVLKLYEARFLNLKKMQKVLLKFLSQHLQVNLAKGVRLSVISAIVFENLRLKRVVLEHLPLESICYALKSQLEFVNVLKASLEKDESVLDAGPSVDYLYYKTLKMGLFHFQRLRTFHTEELIVRSSNVQKLQSKITTFVQVCNYLNNEGLHKIPNKRKLNKDALMSRSYRTKQVSVIVDSLKRTQRVATETEVVRTRRTHQQRPAQEIVIELPTMRAILLCLISERIDKAKGLSYSELSKIPNPYSLAGRRRLIKNVEVQQLLAILGDKSLVLIYNIACIFNHCLEHPPAIFHEIGQRLVRNPRYDFPEFLDLYITYSKDQLVRLKEINYWRVPHIQLLLKYLTNEYDATAYLQLYVTKILNRLRSEQLLFYLPQLYQTLTLRSGDVMFKFMLEYAEKSTLFAHQLIWISKVEAKQEIDPHNKTKRTPEIDAHLNRLSLKSMEVIDLAIRNMDSEETSFWHLEDDFFERVTAISGKLMPKMPTDVKRNIIQEELEKIPVTPEIYMPTNPRFQVSAIKLDSGMPMQSAAKCPILVTFYCTRYGGPDQYFEEKIKAKKKRKFEEFDRSISRDLEKQPSLPMLSPHVSSMSHTQLKLGKGMSQSTNQPAPLEVEDITIKFEERKTVKTNSVPPRRVMELMSPANELKDLRFPEPTEPRTEVSCIFKVFDDIRQDCLALQIIRLMQEIFDKNNLDLFLYPYKTISNRTGRELDIGGIIECVPNTLSRDGIGKINKESLYEYFINKFGPEHNQNFQQARDNFIKSQAAYSVVSYLLQIKDRHNGNILINNEGYLIHIDFGFIFDISPANNMRFESANFKLTEEMIKIMGGSTSSEPFCLYLNLVIKAFLVVRRYHQHIYNTVKQMVKSGLPCFLPQTLDNLHNRFALHMNDFEAAKYMRDIVFDAADKWTTNWYDRIQWIQQKIYH